MTDLETLEELKGLYRMILSSPDYIIQLSLGNHVSIAETYKDLKRTFELAEAKVREMELEQAKQSERPSGQ